MNAVLTVTNLEKDRRWQSRTLERGVPDCVHQVSIFPSCRYQRFEGFGGAFTEAAAYNWARLPEEKRQEFLDACFGPAGLGYT